MELIIACPRLAYLVLQCCPDRYDASLMVLPQRCPHMRALEIRGCKITMRGVNAVIQGCRQLKHLTVPWKLFDETEKAAAASGLTRLNVYYESLSLFKIYHV